MILAPLRGVTVRCFREVFAEPIRKAGFTEAISPFISANVGVDPLKGGELHSCGIPVTPQFIGKDPLALRDCLERVKAAGFKTADLNCGCPYPMVRNKGRGSGLLRTPEVLERMLAVGCETMGEGGFSVKARLGVDRADELLGILPVLNSFPLRFLCVHPRTARQMYDGPCDWRAFGLLAEKAKMPLVRNGDIPLPLPPELEEDSAHVMVGRGLLRGLGARGDIGPRLAAYIDASLAELGHERAVLGRIKELLAYWREIPRWRRLWPGVKIARTLGELRLALRLPD